MTWMVLPRDSLGAGLGTEIRGGGEIFCERAGHGGAPGGGVPEGMLRGGRQLRLNFADDRGLPGAEIRSREPGADEARTTLVWG